MLLLDDVQQASTSPVADDEVGVGADVRLDQGVEVFHVLLVAAGVDGSHEPLLSIDGFDDVDQRHTPYQTDNRKHNSREKRKRAKTRKTKNKKNIKH